MKPMYRRLCVFALTSAIASLVLVRGVAAHHSDSLYFVDDRSADGGSVRIEGTISKVRWINPHTEFFVDVASESGEPVVWAIETDSVNQLKAMGWDEHTLQVGDKVAAIVSKSKFDDTEGRLRDLLLYGSTPDEKTAIYLEYKSDGKPQWAAPYALYQKYTSCPGTVPYDKNRQPGKETLLCVRVDAKELAAAREEFGDRIPLLGGK